MTFFERYKPLSLKTRNSRNPAKFENWIKKVDTIFYSQIGLSYNDIEDWLWYEQFDRGFTPAQAFNNWLEEQGESFDYETYKV